MKITITLAYIFSFIFSQCKRAENAIHKYAAERSVESGKPSGLILSAYKTTMIDNGKDETLIRAFVVDSAGREITTAELPIEITIWGDAKIAGTKNSIPVEYVKAEEGTSFWNSRI